MPPVLVADSRYQFVPPHDGVFWPRLLGRLTPLYLRRRHGITDIEVRGAERLQELQNAGHGLLLAPNHCRMSDAIVLQSLSNHLRQPFYIMASAHLFRGGRFLAWLLRRLGAFSVYREGIDRQAVQKAIDILVDGRRPLVIFPEGALSQANEHLQALQEGVSFIARTAASRIEKNRPSGPPESDRCVYTVPVAIRYVYGGDIEEAAGALLTRIEQRLSWRPLEGQCLVTRIYRVGQALLALKEQEYLGQPQSGEIDERLNRLINHLLVPLETEWLNGPKQGTAITRVRELRRAILPGMIEGHLPSDEVERRWQQLSDASLAQSLSLYPPRYVASRPTADRILETVQRFSEHLAGEEAVHGPMKAIIQVGEPIVAGSRRDRAAETDPLLHAVEQSLRQLLEQSATECAMYRSATHPGV